MNKANVAKGTFYLYFKDKYEIRDILIQKETRKLFHQSIEELNQNDIRDFEDRIIFIINHVILQFQMHPEILNFIKKNLSWGLFQSTLNEALNHDTYDLIEIFKKEITSYSFKDTSRLTGRGIYNGKLGFVTTEKDDATTPLYIINSIKDAASVINSDDEAIIYKGAEKYKKKKPLARLFFLEAPPGISAHLR